jgi:hypothetical protein
VGSNPIARSNNSNNLNGLERRFTGRVRRMSA